MSASDYKDLVFQPQPTSDTCVHACIAMLMGEPVEEVAKAISLIVGRQSGVTTRELHTILDTGGFEWNQLTYPELTFDGWYILGVPSLNVPGGGHAILVKAEEGRIVQVHDPRQNATSARDTHYYVVSDAMTAYQHTVRRWHISAWVHPGGSLDRLKRAGINNV